MSIINLIHFIHCKYNFCTSQSQKDHSLKLLPILFTQHIIENHSVEFSTKFCVCHNVKVQQESERMFKPYAL
jgi:hypothetical protein